MAVQDSLSRAVELFRAGDIAEAEAVLRRILPGDPRNADALHLLGLLAHHAGRSAVAADLIGNAVSINPRQPDYQINHGVALAAAGRIDEAIIAYRNALALRPDSVEALSNFGDALCQKEDWEQAIIICRKALALRPDLAEPHCNLGKALQEKRRFDEAIACHQSALAIRPGYYQARNNLGTALGAKGDWTQAIAHYEQALALCPASVEILNNLAKAFYERRQFESAIAYCRQALSFAPGHLEISNTLGNIFYRMGDLPQAIAYFRHVLRHDPDRADAHWNLGQVLLAQGDYAGGWPRYEWRWRLKKRAPRTHVQGPAWDGSDLAGRSILLFAEQGFGDTIHFIRYIPHVAKRGGKIVLACQPEMLRLLQNMEGVAQTVPWTPPFPGFDVQCSLLSLPGIFNTTLSDIPAIIPYLRPDETLVRQWKARLAPDGPLNVGLAWAGKPDPTDRSAPAAIWSSLAGIPNVRFVSLQKWDAERQHQLVPLEVLNWTSELMDFADTAALIASLDLVVTIDTAVAHLAGALGKPTWVLLKSDPDWRWMLNRADSPWYPTMRLFREPRVGDWDTPMNQIVEALKSTVA
jgi:tetratricopeptide (TPR) repeat protein